MKPGVETASPSTCKAFPQEPRTVTGLSAELLGSPELGNPVDSADMYSREGRAPGWSASPLPRGCTTNKDDRGFFGDIGRRHTVLECEGQWPVVGFGYRCKPVPHPEGGFAVTDGVRDKDPERGKSGGFDLVEHTEPPGVIELTPFLPVNEAVVVEGKRDTFTWAFEVGGTHQPPQSSSQSSLRDKCPARMIRAEHHHGFTEALNMALSRVLQARHSPQGSLPPL